MSSTRREHQRYQVAIPVEVSYQGGSFAGMSRNISLSGMFIVCLDTVPFGETIKLKFELELERLRQPVVTEAVVRWVESSSGIGVQFTGLRAREVWALQQLFASAEATSC